MKLLPVLLVTLLPSVVLAGVEVTTIEATVDTYLGLARNAVDRGDFVAAWVMYECALTREPGCPEALAGRLAARAAATDCQYRDLVVARTE